MQTMYMHAISFNMICTTSQFQDLLSFVVYHFSNIPAKIHNNIGTIIIKKMITGILIIMYNNVVYILPTNPKSYNLLTTVDYKSVVCYLIILIIN